MDIQSLEPEPADQLQMNDIATVEIETSTPLFFDSYQQNRITGSFIIIDPLTNATLGAGMIQAPLSKNDDAPSAKQSAESPITSLERYQRHGHYPAIFSISADLISNRPSLLHRLERAFFEAGFEVIVVNATQGSFLAQNAKNAWNVLYAAGFVVICISQGQEQEKQVKLEPVAGTRSFDLDKLILASEDADAVRQTLCLAESLRITSRNDGPEEELR